MHKYTSSVYRLGQRAFSTRAKLQTAHRFYTPSSHNALDQHQHNSEASKDNNSSNTGGHSKERAEEIGVFRAYGKPVATLFLWSALTYMTFQAVWSKLYFDEVRLETEAKIDDLKDELDKLEHTR
ncbi:hypothetical protein H4217_002294 [Coemansia sp. RSA 1939]|nr:hypothetical protein H4217_002294 [Coemansia sp. RSA 1939]KAJ2616137.1 hypothetical protein EV177_001222 [Coemansia sp. RSA 1804]KAJ2682727.1 hypothetical protein GGH99_004626 [Coemansia sp. RSA 1285]